MIKHIKRLFIAAGVIILSAFLGMAFFLLTQYLQYG